MNLKEKIRKLEQDFESKSIHRVGEEPKNITKLDSNSPLYNTVRECHQGMFPDDFIFETCHTLLNAALGYDFDDFEELQEHTHEIYDGAVSIYNYELLDWAKRFSHFVDAAREEGLLVGETDFMKQLQAGQYFQISEIGNMLFSDIDEMDFSEDTEESPMEIGAPV